MIQAAQKLIDSIADDNNHHGGLLSRNTTRYSDELRVIVNRILTDQAHAEAVKQQEKADQCELPLS